MRIHGRFILFSFVLDRRRKKVAVVVVVFGGADADVEGASNTKKLYTYIFTDNGRVRTPNCVLLCT